MTDPAAGPVWRWRRAAVAAALVALCFLQDAGRIVPDTKLDLVVDPVRFLGRALSVWDDTGFAGQLQNQAYGYLAPMGPFFAAGGALLDPWVVQRLWWALLLVTAFLGLDRLARALDIGSPATRMLAAVAFALSPRVVSVLGPVSAEAWPMALAPWVLLPLVEVFRRGRSPLRGGVEAALPVLLMGGVNAALDLAAVLPAALYLLTRPFSSRTGRTWLAWVGATALATAWWVVPLLILGRYSPPFLDYIESASTTTLVTSLADSLRGASQWVAYLPPGLGGTWRAGQDLVVQPPLVLYSMLVAAAGLAGLALPGLRERRWLVLTLSTSLVVLTAGHAATFGSPVDGPVRDLLDGPLAPLRNVHKFDVGVRLALALGLAHLLAVAPAGLRRLAGGPRLVVGLVGVVVLAVGFAGAGPFLTDRVAPRGSFTEVPGYWADAGRWLEEHPAGRTLLAPQSRFASYAWGLPGDEPLQALTRASWDVRNAVPLTPPGHVRLLDAVSEAWETGGSVPGLSALLARSGVGYVLVRHDLDTQAAGAPRPELVDAVLGASPGFTRVAGFGPRVGRPDPALGRPLRSPAVADAQVVEVWRVEPGPARATAAAPDDVVELLGGPEGLLRAEEAGVLDGAPTVLGVDRVPELPTGRVVLTDSLARREVDVGRSAADRSAVLAADDDGTLGTAAREWTVGGDASDETSAVWLGARSVTASSSASSLGGRQPAQRWRSPAQAFDGDPDTAWWPVAEDRAPTLTVRYAGPVVPGRVTVTLAGDGSPPSGTVRIGDGTTETDVRVADGRAVLRVDRPVSTLTVQAPGATGVAEVDVTGAPVRSARRTPALDVTNRPSAVVLASDPGHRDGCVGPFERLTCDPLLAARSEEEAGLVRVLPVTGRDRYAPALTVRPVGGPALDARIARAAGLGVEVTSSSSGVTSPGGSALAAVDGLTTTTWTAAAGDDTPSLTLRWDGARRLSRVALRTADDARASRPTTVRVRAGDVDVLRAVGSDGTVELPPTRTDSLTVTVLGSSGRPGLDPVDGTQQLLPVGVTELEVPGVTSGVVEGTTEVRWRCGEGPEVEVGGVRLPTAVTTTVADLATGTEVPARVCGSDAVVLDGETVVSVERTDTLAPARLSLVGSTWTTPVPARPASTTGGGTEVTVTAPPGVDAGATLLTRPLNTNPGWVADDPRVTPVVVDGWQQGFVVPAGDTAVSARFAPAGLYRGAVVGGLALAALVALAALWSRRRRTPAGATVAVAGRGLPRPLRWSAVVVTAGLLGGVAGLALVVATASATGWAGRRRTARHRAGVVGLLLVVAGVLMAAAPWGSARHDALAPAVQLLGLAAVVLTLVPLPRRDR
ncbi:DUF3367 domain-containing protein [Phycicoccus sp. MAQZ13P-2]|uniref:alpha-(1->3)-arabinofuranosyltransferase domain-containing protein n=1 Tax=Phycicoccus mangrovi TaxID=2840470 RepID=UPI001C005607|nr:alpha-(1->3)-arabinofuranosyltransferase family protein [Phycicoccus mangrovi]MBT9257023.1 DUF3367 domain-containing protein [Phycicoccus mangrovi]MBT9275487.1 DUF3367 domain-containing protein [Phycicoccus mangrovi]